MALPENDSCSVAEFNRSVDGGHTPESVIVPVVFGIIFVLGVVGNILVLVVIGKVGYSAGGGGGGGSGGGVGRRSLSPTNIFILNLSVADLGFLLFCVPFQATIYTLPEWVFGAFLCTFVHYIFTVNMLVSIFTLVAMSVDRYIAVVRSNKSLSVRSPRNALAGLCVIWTMSLVCSVPVAKHQGLISYHNGTFCWEDWAGASKNAYKVTLLVLGYLLPLLLISCCYTKHPVDSHRCCVSLQTAQTVLLVVTVFTICWMPHHIIVMWAEFGTFPLTQATYVFRLVSHCLSYGNSCVNPILYAFLSENFRKACRKVFTCYFLYPPPPTENVVRFRMENFSTTHSTTNI
ncbi:galanin receptor type 1b [Neolamprologus brichardi]|uniref:galanin receptor type 1b n=1 Tax=Neolamprologus brichardi TaxID=32507 RepID=UPI0003EC53CE|nr:galanin receptor type 1b [Neolamprologus brichardi]